MLEPASKTFLLSKTSLKLPSESEHITQIHPKSLGNFCDIYECHVSLTPFQSPDIGAIQTSLIRQGHLRRDALLQAESLHSFTKLF